MTVVALPARSIELGVLFLFVFFLVLEGGVPSPPGFPPLLPAFFLLFLVSFLSLNLSEFFCFLDRRGRREEGVRGSKVFGLDFAFFGLRKKANGRAFVLYLLTTPPGSASPSLLTPSHSF